MQQDLIGRGLFAGALSTLLVPCLAAGLDGPVGGSATWRGDTLHLTSGSHDERGGWFAKTYPMRHGPDSTPKGFRASFNLMMAASAGVSRVDFLLGEPPESPGEEDSDGTGLVVSFSASSRAGDQAIGQIEVRWAGRSVASSAPRRLRTGVPVFVEIEITPAGELTVLHHNASDPVLAILRCGLASWHIAPEWRPGIVGASTSPGASQWVGSIRLFQEPSECGNGNLEIGEDCEWRSEKACWDRWCSRRCTIDVPVRGVPTGLSALDQDACSAPLPSEDMESDDPSELAILGRCRLHKRSIHLIPTGEEMRLVAKDDRGRTAIDDVIPGQPWDAEREEGWRTMGHDRAGNFRRLPHTAASGVQGISLKFRRADTFRMKVKLDHIPSPNVEAGRPLWIHLESKSLTADCRAALRTAEAADVRNR